MMLQGIDGNLQAISEWSWKVVETCIDSASPSYLLNLFDVDPASECKLHNDNSCIMIITNHAHFEHMSQDIARICKAMLLYDESIP